MELNYRWGGKYSCIVILLMTTTCLLGTTLGAPAENIEKEQIVEPVSEIKQEGSSNSIHKRRAYKDDDDINKDTSEEWGKQAGRRLNDGDDDVVDGGTTPIPTPPEPSTSAPEPSTSAPEPTTATSEPETSAPEMSTSVPESSTKSEPFTEIPEAPTQAPDQNDSAEKEKTPQKDESTADNTQHIPAELKCPEASDLVLGSEDFWHAFKKAIGWKNGIELDKDTAHKSLKGIRHCLDNIISEVSQPKPKETNTTAPLIQEILKETGVNLENPTGYQPIDFVAKQIAMLIPSSVINGEGGVEEGTNPTEKENDNIKDGFKFEKESNRNKGASQLALVHVNPEDDQKTQLNVTRFRDNLKKQLFYHNPGGKNTNFISSIQKKVASHDKVSIIKGKANDDKDLNGGDTDMVKIDPYTYLKLKKKASKSSFNLALGKTHGEQEVSEQNDDTTESSPKEDSGTTEGTPNVDVGTTESSPKVDIDTTEGGPKVDIIATTSEMPTVETA